ncbi:Hypothetical protein R9X50_00467200 [Acrodontium crateriforme]|uniref:Ras-GAP domain-containing protein n=1 Tax=Acrodontium crateriforme TaxID=150365 RepID=A0AAQ3M5Y9_9PEZI|nr:Hypothetical protein R9X50_00467200 [Acrodontium crateriforme]
MDQQRRGSARQRWTLERRRKEPSLYDEWLNQEKPQQAPTPPPRRDSAPLRHGSTTSVATTAGQRESSGTIRPVTPADSFTTITTTSSSSIDDGDGDATHDERAFALDHEITSFERAFIPNGAAAAPGGGLHLSSSNDSSPSGAAILPGSPGLAAGGPIVHDREWDRDVRVGPISPPSSRNGNRVLRSLTRRASKSRNSGPPSLFVAMGGREAYDMNRPRTRTLDERTRRELSPSATPPSVKNRNRLASVPTSSPPNVQGVEYLMSEPGSHAPSPMSSLAAAMQSPTDVSGRCSTSDDSSDFGASFSSQLPFTSARRVTRLIRERNGQKGGTVQFRRGSNGAWNQSFAYVNEQSASLLYESKNNDGAHRTLIPELRGCYVRPCTENDHPYLEVTSPHSDLDVHLKMLTRVDFEEWYAVLLYWQSRDRNMDQSETDAAPSSESISDGTTPSAPDPPPRLSSTRRRSRNDSRSERKKSVANVPKEAPVIKIGSMIFWDTNIGYSNTSIIPVGQISTLRPQAQRTHSYATRRWQRISGQLRENGELKLHADSDNSLISVVQLSQLSRCAIQRLDPSVLDNDFCIAIYPQYTSTGTSDRPNLHRPMFLSLESRVLYEVWFVLLRAFTIPQLYGPSSAAEVVQGGEMEKELLEESVVTTTSDMFRVERSLNIRIIEAKMHTAAGAAPAIPINASRNSAPNPKAPQGHCYYAEVLLDNETRARTAVKQDTSLPPNPLWGESFEFLDLPPVLTSANVVIKRRPTEGTQNDKVVAEAYGLTGDHNCGYTNFVFDTTVGKTEIYLHELEADKEIEKWWPVITASRDHVGDVLIRARADEGVILMARDYQGLSDLLHQFSNGITLQVASLVSSDLKRLSDCLLDIYQVSGHASDWLMALAEDEIDGIHKESTMQRLRFDRRLGSNEPDPSSNGNPAPDREIIVRDLNKNATLEANLLFRGNTLLTKSLDTHMRRVGKEYLEESLTAILTEINDKDPDCEVDPNRVNSPQDLDRNWRRLLLFTQQVWKSIVAAKQKCPLELRLIFRHIQACAEDRYGDFLRSVKYSSVSGFLFLRFFCPAVLNPKLFGLLKSDVKMRARRTLTLIAKSLQTLSNMASFGTKEHWMEPMNAFLTQHREGFKTFIDDVCYVEPTNSSFSQKRPSVSPQYSPGVVSTEKHLSYTTPMTIMQRLPPTSREGFPSLPYLIDQARAFADLVQVWLDSTNPTANTSSGPRAPSNFKGRPEMMQAIRDSGEDLRLFHELCTTLHTRTQECLSRAERAEHPHSDNEFHWEDLIGQLHDQELADSSDGMSNQISTDALADKIASEPSILPLGMHGHDSSTPAASRPWETMVLTDEEDDLNATPVRLPTLPQPIRTYETTAAQTRPGSSGLSMHATASSIQNSFRRALASRGSENNFSAPHSGSASASNLSSAVNSDVEGHSGLHSGQGVSNNQAVSSSQQEPTTALPSYEQEARRYRERREAAKIQIQQQVEEARMREAAKKERKANKGSTSSAGITGALRKKKDKEKEKERDSEMEKNENFNGQTNLHFPAHRGGGVDFGGMI